MDISIKWLNDLLRINFPIPRKTNFEKFLVYYGLNPNYLTLNGFEVEQLKLHESGDVILDIDVTPNRRDINSMIGICEELEILLNTQIKIPSFYAIKEKPQSTKFNLPKDDQKQTKHNFFTLQIHGIQIKKSPKWLTNRLISYGIEPVNNVIDIIRYIQLEWGQPIQIYDIHKLHNLNLKLKKIEKQQEIPTSKGLLTLKNQSLILSNNSDCLALSGIEENSLLQVDETTSAIFLEFIHYTRSEIRKNSYLNNIKNDKSKLFERGLNTNLIPMALQRTLKLFQLLHPKARIKSGPFKSPEFEPNKVIQLSLNQVNSILGNRINGKKITMEELKICLKRLKFEIIEDEQTQLTLVIPYSRSQDLEEEIDVIEEIGRIYGFNNFKSQLPYLQKIGAITNEQKLIDYLKTYLIHQGFYELMNYSFSATEPKSKYKLLNPLGIGHSLQNGIAMNLIETINYNTKQQNYVTRGFEIGRVFQLNVKDQEEITFLGGFLSNEKRQISWTGQHQKTTWYQLKELITNILSSLNIQSINWVPIKNAATNPFHPSNCSFIYTETTNIGMLSQLSPLFTHKQGIPTETFLFELNLTLISGLKSLQVNSKYEHYPTLPSTVRDISITIPNKGSTKFYTNALTTIINEKPHFIKNITLKDHYEFAKNNEKYRTLTYSLKFQSSKRTLTNEEIDSWVNKFTKNVQKKLML